VPGTEVFRAGHSDVSAIERDAYPFHPTLAYGYIAAAGAQEIDSTHISYSD
jgi:hypothetical protein